MCTFPCFLSFKSNWIKFTANIFSWIPCVESVDEVEKNVEAEVTNVESVEKPVDSGVTNVESEVTSVASEFPSVESELKTVDSEVINVESDVKIVKLDETRVESVGTKVEFVIVNVDSLGSIVESVKSNVESMGGTIDEPVDKRVESDDSNVESLGTTVEPDDTVDITVEKLEITVDRIVGNFEAIYTVDKSVDIVGPIDANVESLESVVTFREIVDRVVFVSELEEDEFIKVIVVEIEPVFADVGLDANTIESDDVIFEILVDSDDLIVETNGKFVESDEEIVDSDDKIVDPDDRIVESDDRIVESDDKIVESDDLTVEPDDEIVESKVESDNVESEEKVDVSVVVSIVVVVVVVDFVVFLVVAVVFWRNRFVAFDPGVKTSSDNLFVAKEYFWFISLAFTATCFLTRAVEGFSATWIVLGDVSENTGRKTSFFLERPCWEMFLIGVFVW